MKNKEKWCILFSICHTVPLRLCQTWTSRIIFNNIARIWRWPGTSMWYNKNVLMVLFDDRGFWEASWLDRTAWKSLETHLRFHFYYLGLLEWTSLQAGNYLIQLLSGGTIELVALEIKHVVFVENPLNPPGKCMGKELERGTPPTLCQSPGALGYVLMWPIHCDLSSGWAQQLLELVYIEWSLIYSEVSTGLRECQLGNQHLCTFIISVSFLWA